MEVEKTNSLDNRKDDDGTVLPGFRFHPTDEELVGFYLMRKVENKPISLELIKQVDIYKYDPWDLPSKLSFHGFFSLLSLSGPFTLVASGSNRGSFSLFFYSDLLKYIMPN